MEVSEEDHKESDDISSSKTVTDGANSVHEKDPEEGIVMRLLDIVEAS